MNHTIKHLQTLFNYNKVTGVLTWAVDRYTGKSYTRKHVCAGDVAGTLYSTGYRVVRVGNTPYLVHRLSWALHYGRWPRGAIDHINCNRQDNRICNLRLASSSENNKNRTISTRNTSGVKGVTWSETHCKWRVRIVDSNGRKTHVGYFTHLNAAAVAAEMFRTMQHGEYANHG